MHKIFFGTVIVRWLQLCRVITTININNYQINKNQMNAIFTPQPTCFLKNGFFLLQNSQCLIKLLSVWVKVPERSKNFKHITSQKILSKVSSGYRYFVLVSSHSANFCQINLNFDHEIRIFECFLGVSYSPIYGLFRKCGKMHRHSGWSFLHFKIRLAIAPFQWSSIGCSSSCKARMHAYAACVSTDKAWWHFPDLPTFLAYLLSTQDSCS